MAAPAAKGRVARRAVVRGRRRALLRAGIGLALSFDTWRTLVLGHGLTDAQAVEVALRLACESPTAEVDESTVSVVAGRSTRRS